MIKYFVPESGNTQAEIPVEKFLGYITYPQFSFSNRQIFLLIIQIILKYTIKNYIYRIKHRNHFTYKIHKKFLHDTNTIKSL